MIIYKICAAAHWQAALNDGVLRGTAVDLRDGYIHFSTAEQLGETAAKHFAGQSDLVLIAADSTALGAALRFEPSRRGALFPHLYGELPLAAVLWTRAIVLRPDGSPVLPDLA